jgi:hypothetical protein
MTREVLFTQQLPVTQRVVARGEPLPASLVPGYCITFECNAVSGGDPVLAASRPSGNA